MPERYQGPIQKDELGKPRQMVVGKWIRLYENLYVSSPTERIPDHTVIAHTMQLDDAIQITRQSEPEQVDAGTFIIDNFDTPQVQRKQIKLIGESQGLDLPEQSVKEQAIAISAEVWSAQSPGFNVISKR